MRLGLISNPTRKASLVPTYYDFASLEEAYNELFAQHRVIDVPADADPEFYKRNQPAFTAGLCPDGVPLINANVRAVSTLVLDLDDVPKDALLARLASWPTGYILYTSWKDGAKAEDSPLRCRLIVPLTEPVAVEDWAEVWRRARGWSGLAEWIDTTCKDARRVYFLPCHPSTNKRKGLSFFRDGPALDVDTLPDVEDEPAPPSSTISKLELEALCEKWKRRGPLKPFGKVLAKALAGEAFAKQGERESVVFQLADRLAKDLPDVVPESIAQHFDGAFSALERLGPGCPTVDDFARKIASQQAFYATRDKPQPVDMPEDRPWIVSHKEAFYVLSRGDRYLGPHTKTSFLGTVEEELADRNGFNAYRILEHGRVRKSTVDLLSEYGRVAEEVIWDLSSQRSYFDPNGKQLVLAPCPLRVVEPKRHDEIDRWIDTFSDPDTLRRWIAAATYVQEPCSALYLSGAPGAGKSLLAMGLSRLWTEEGPTAAYDALGPWNAKVLKCPLVFADERLPAYVKGDTGRLREVIQQRERQLSQKYVPGATIRGAIRLILAANNMDLLDTHEDLDPNDLDAIRERFLHVVTPTETAEYIRHLGGPKAVADWVLEDKIAQHALALAEEYPPNPKIRWLVQQHGPHAEDFSIRLAVSSGARNDACSAIVRGWQQVGKELVHVTDDGTDDEGKSEPCIVMTLVKLRSLWAGIETRRQASDKTLADALRAISLKVEGEKFFVRGRFLVVWNERTRSIEPRILRAFFGL